CVGIAVVDGLASGFSFADARVLLSLETGRFDAGADLGVLEQGHLHRFARARRPSRAPAQAAMLDDNRDGVARVVGRRIGDEKVVVLLVPRTTRPLARAGAVVSRLGRAGLARHLDRAQPQLTV